MTFQMMIGSDSSQPEEDVITKERVTNLYSDFSPMPPCSEKTAVHLIYLLSLQLIRQTIVPEDKIVIPISIDTEIVKTCECLNAQLRIEEIGSPQIRHLIGEVLVNVKDENWKSAFSVSNKILKLIRPLNMHELFRLVEKGQ